MLMQFTKTNKRKTKYHGRNKVAGLHVMSLGIMLISVIFTGGVVLASEIHANMTEEKLTKQQQQVNEELRDIKSQLNNKENSQVSQSTQNKPNKESDEKQESVSSEKTDEEKKVAIEPPPTPTPAPISTPLPPPPPAPAPPPPVSASGLETTSSLNYINSVRSSAGKSTLQASSTADQWALNHAQTLGNTCSLFHQEISEFLGRSVAGKSVVGVAENVGYASSVPLVLDGLKNSPGHYGNMIGNYTHVGIGVVQGSDGCSQYVYTAQVFVRLN